MMTMTTTTSSSQLIFDQECGLKPVAADAEYREHQKCSNWLINFIFFTSHLRSSSYVSLSYEPVLFANDCHWVLYHVGSM